MLEHEIKNKVLTIGNRKGQTVYYAYPKSQQKLTNDMVVERIVRETSLSEGDVKNALISLSNNDNGGATKVDGTNVTWQTAVDAMNAALQNAGSEWRYELTGALPTLKKQ